MGFTSGLPPKEPESTNAAGEASLGGEIDEPEASASAPRCRKLSDCYSSYFERLACQRESEVGLGDFHSLVVTVCERWRVQPPDGVVVAHAFWRHRVAGHSGISLEGFANCAEEILGKIVAEQPGLVAPPIEEIIEHRGEHARNLLLHTRLPTDRQSLRSMGVTSVNVTIVEVTGLGGGHGPLRREEDLYCHVVVRRQGRLLPRRSSRRTSQTESSLRDGFEGEGRELFVAPAWKFGDELIFDDASLLYRRGDLYMEVYVKKATGLLSCSLVAARCIQVPTPGIIQVPLLDPTTGQRQGKVSLSAGWPCSDGFADFFSDQLRQNMQDGLWDQTRTTLRMFGAGAVEYVAGRPDNVGRSLLVSAIRHGTAGTPLVRDLLANSSVAWFMVDAYGASAVHHAAFNGSLESLAALLGSGLSPDAPAPGINGVTPLMLAAFRGSIDHVRLLIGFGARADAVDARGLPPSGWALGGSALWRLIQPWAAGQEKMECSPSAACDTYVREAAPPVQEGVFVYLLDEHWRTAPPRWHRGAADQCGNKWLQLADDVANNDANHALLIFAAEIRSHCEDALLGPQDTIVEKPMYKGLISKFFVDAIAQRREHLAVRLAEELNVLEGFEEHMHFRQLESNGAIGTSETWSPQGAQREAALEAALEAGMPQLVCTLLDNADIGQPARVVQLLRLAVQRANKELLETVVEQLPEKMVQDNWREPVVPGTKCQDCPVCYQTLASKCPVALCCEEADDSSSIPSMLSCQHFVCESCSRQVNNKCPMCRAEFGSVLVLPSPATAPISWFNFTASFASSPEQPVNTSDVLTYDDCAGSTPEASAPVDGPSAATGVPAQNANVQGAPLWQGGLVGGENVPDDTPQRYLKRENLEDILPATVLIDPQALCSALDSGLWDDWDADGDGKISVADFFEPERGLLRWLLVHSQTADKPPDFENLPRAWFVHMAHRGGGEKRPPNNRRPSLCGFIQIGDALCALLQMTGISSLDAAEIAQLRTWVADQWPDWATDEGVDFEVFDRDGGVRDSIFKHAQWIRTSRAVARLSEPGAGPIQQVEALRGLYMVAVGSISAISKPASQGVGDVDKQAAADGNSAADMVQCAVKFCSGSSNESRQLLLRHGLSCALAAIQKHPNHPQIVPWSCRLVITLLLGMCKSVAAIPTDEVSWPRIIRAVREGSLLQDFEQASESACDVEQVVQAVTRAMGLISSAPRGSADQILWGIVKTTSLLLWVLDAADPSSSILSTLSKLKFHGTLPTLRAFAGVTSFLLLGDAVGASSCLEAWGHQPSTFWSPPSTMPSGQVMIGQAVEVCCQNGWMSGVVSRAPALQPTQPRDECWVIQSENEVRIFSRHVWAPGWRTEAARSLERLRLSFVARAFSRRPPSPPSPDLGQIRRSLLEGIIVKGLAVKAKLPPLAPQGPILRTAHNARAQVGDQVWLTVSVEKAKSLQTQRHGDWSDQMAFCLDCSGRVVETLSNPYRARISHGGLGTFLWNPLCITRVNSTSAPLPFEEQHGPIVLGDEVLLCSSQEVAVPMQIGHGGWSTRMAPCLGRYGRVATLNSRGDVRLDIPGCGAFLWNPAVIEPVGQGCVVMMCAQALSRLDDEGAAVTLLFILNEFAGMQNAETEVLEEIWSALLRGSDGPDVTPNLRSFGALALLAASVDIRQLISNGPGEFLNRSGAALRPPCKPSPLRQATLVACASEAVFAFFSTSPATQWPAAETGGVAVLDVVRGLVDISTAAERWLFCFFASRHRRFLETSGSTGRFG